MFENDRHRYLGNVGLPNNGKYLSSSLPAVEKEIELLTDNKCCLNHSIRKWTEWPRGRTTGRLLRLLWTL